LLFSILLTKLKSSKLQRVNSEIEFDLK
jgi:hypothetical protein